MYVTASKGKLLSCSVPLLVLVIVQSGTEFLRKYGIQPSHVTTNLRMK